MTGYELSRQWFRFVADNQDKVRAIHSALMYYAVECWNFLGNPETFGLPSSQAATFLGVSYKTYNSAFTDLVTWGFLIEVEKSTNQFTATKVQLNGQVNFTKPPSKAHTKAILNHQPSHYLGSIQPIDLSNDESPSYINKLVNLETTEPTTTEPEKNGVGVLKKILPIEKKIWDHFGLNEQSHFSTCQKTGPFIFMLVESGKLEDFEKEFLAYSEYKGLSGEKRGYLETFLGTPEKKYTDGTWCKTNWSNELNQFKAKLNGKQSNLNGAGHWHSGGRKTFT
jgi:hypothetical protein